MSEASNGGPGRGGVRRWVNALVQLAGFGVGVALLAWCATLALKPENRAQLERLGEAPPGLIAAILGLTLVGLVLDGLVFHALFRPVKRLAPAGVVATNAVAVLLNYLPFKIGLIARVVIHTRRDGVPLFTVGAMLVANAAALACVALPLGVASAWRGTVDAAWVATAVGGAVGLTGLAIVTARALAGPGGLARMSRAVRFVPMLGGALGRALGSRVFQQLHAGLPMVADPRGFAPAVGLRLLHFATMWARFWLAARVAGVPIEPESAVVAGSIFFLIGVFSPGGMLGAREGGTTWLAGRLALSGVTADSFAVVALVVGAAESVVNLFLGGLGLVYLRPDRWLLRRREARAGGGQ